MIDRIKVILTGWLAVGAVLTVNHVLALVAVQSDEINPLPSHVVALGWISLPLTALLLVWSWYHVFVQLRFGLRFRADEHVCTCCSRGFVWLLPWQLYPTLFAVVYFIPASAVMIGLSASGANGEWSDTHIRWVTALGLVFDFISLILVVITCIIHWVVIPINAGSYHTQPLVGWYSGYSVGTASIHLPAKLVPHCEDGKTDGGAMGIILRVWYPAIPDLRAARAPYHDADGLETVHALLKDVLLEPNIDGAGFSPEFDELKPLGCCGCIRPRSLPSWMWSHLRVLSMRSYVAPTPLKHHNLHLWAFRSFCTHTVIAVRDWTIKPRTKNWPLRAISWSQSIIPITAPF